MDFKHDITITIATGANRWAKRWRNKEITWSALVDRLATTARTGETLAEYKRMSKTARDKQKDVGGFVGGKLKGGRRLQQNVLSRQLICLDADKPSEDFLTDVDLVLGGCAYAYYTTHSHTAKAPRYRLIVPLAAEVTPDQYTAISRRIAGDIGIDSFDPTTYDVHRLMYWPSTPSDGQYDFGYNNAPMTEPDEVLSRYHDWRDAAEWPTGSAEAQARTTTAKQQGDPLTKTGLVGAFCRTYYPISKAIEAYLSGVYEETTHTDRYTYITGTTTAGLVIYDDKFAYSHHGTDPTSGVLCNAFDLVRLHLFGDRDDKCGEDTPVNKRPSFTAMSELAMQDKQVTEELSRSALDELFKDAEDCNDDSEWLKTLELSKGKNPVLLPTAQNFIKILSNDKRLAGAFGLDEFSHRILLKKDLPWRKMSTGIIWRDADDAQLRNYLSRVYDLTGRGVIDDALTEVINNNRFHPVVEYLQALTWDGVPRAETIYADYLGAEDSAYLRTVTLQHLKAAVARVLHPGIKFDPCIVLSGPQGIGKSTVLSKLGRQWFNDSVVSLQGKDPMEQLQGSWIIELQEMQATNKAENDQIKAFISRRVDKFRAPYGRRTEEFPRQCVFAATTNDWIFLKDRTGGRRFWPVFATTDAAKTLDELTPEVVDQIWAEVYQSYKQDSRLTLPTEIAQEAAALQQAHTEGSERAGLIEDYLEKKLPENWAQMDLYERRAYLEDYSDADEAAGVVRDRVCVLEIWCEALGNSKERLKNSDSREINAILQNLPNWIPHESVGNLLRFGTFYGRQRAYVRR